MPSVIVTARVLYGLIGRVYTYKEIEQMCMEFGVELDEVTVDPSPDGTFNYDSLDAKFKIDVAANRYDLLCVEGLANALRIYAGLQPSPSYQTVTSNEPLVLNQDASTLGIRPFVVAAVLRNVNLTQEAYDSFIDLQDKLHFNIGRRRTLVSIGTHDLDAIQGPFTYTAKPYNEINFVALSQTTKMNVNELFDFYKKKEQCHLKPYLDIAEIPQEKAGIQKEKWLHPVILDARGEVLSLPPVINSEYSKISTNTKNIFIEITANDFTKCNIVLNIVTALFSEHCQGDDKFSIETVLVNHPRNIPFPPGVDNILRQTASTETERTVAYPNLATQSISVDTDFINNGLGLKLSNDEICSLLKKMQLTTQIDPTNGKKLLVSPPPTRSDLLQQVDVQEDVAIAYGYNNLPRALPQCMTIGSEQPLNQLSNHLRYAVAGCGYIEVMTWALIQTEENFEKINRVDPGNLCVTISNSKTDFTACRTTLLPGLLKVVQANTSFKIPIQIFELGDVITLNPADPEGATNHRHLGVLYGSHTAGFEEVHAVLTRVMEQLRVPFVPYNALDKIESNAKQLYTIIPITHENHSFLPKRCADVVLLNKNAQGKFEQQHIGQIGVVHPNVLANFDIGEFVPCSILEIDIEAFV